MAIIWCIAEKNPVENKNRLFQTCQNIKPPGRTYSSVLLYLVNVEIWIKHNSKFHVTFKKSVSKFKHTKDTQNFPTDYHNIPRCYFERPW